MPRTSVQLVAKIVATITFLLLPLAPGMAEAVSDQPCTKDSDPSPFVRIDSASCGVYKELIGHRTADTGEQILLRYMVHTPKQTPKGIVVLIAGGILQTGIMGNAGTGTVTQAGQNFLVRSAQLFAEDGYIAITINRPLKATASPSPEFPDTIPQWDHYRVVSPKHAYDIIRVVAVENTMNLPLFLAGTSRGALSVVSNNMLGNGILLSSPVTSGPAPSGTCPTDPTCALYVTHPYPRLQPAFVTVPAHVMAHEADACAVTLPADALALHNALVTAGIESRFDAVQGGFAFPGEDVCEALNFHGFLGQETKAVKYHTKRMDDILSSWRRRFPSNTRPAAVPGAMSSQTAYVLDLATLVTDPGDTLTYLLPHPTSWRGHALSLAGSTVTYTPPASGSLTDGFTYVVSDGKGGISASYVVISVP